MPRLRRLLPGLLCLPLLAGCSLVNLAYNNAPALATSRLEDAFALTAEQSALLEPKLAQLFAWHRREELPRYRDLLEQAATLAEDGVSAAEIIWLSDTVRAEWLRLQAQVIACCGDLAAQLSAEQVEQFAQDHRERIAEHDDYVEMSAQQREIHRVDKQVKRLRKWFGRFDELLEARIRERLARVPDIWLPWLQYREQRHQALLRVLGRTTDPGSIRRELESVLLDPDSAHARAFDPARRAYWREYAVAIEEISGWMSRQQRQRAIERLREFADVVTQLAAAD